MISVSCLDDFGFHCTFGEKQCFLKYCNKDVGLAVRRGKLYMLNLSDYPICVNLCEMNMNECNHEKNGRSTNPSSKLWHRRLGHISRGGMERLIKVEILPPLDFSDAGNCIDCIKGKYVKTIKKGAVRATRVLELIHTDICGPFNVKSMVLILSLPSHMIFLAMATFTLYMIDPKLWTNLRFIKQRLKINLI